MQWLEDEAISIITVDKLIILQKWGVWKKWGDFHLKTRGINSLHTMQLYKPFHSWWDQVLKVPKENLVDGNIE